MIYKIKKAAEITLLTLLFMLFFQPHGYSVETILKVAVEPNLPPYQFTENGEYIGVHIDLLNSIAKKYNFIIEYIPVKNSIEAAESLTNGEVDIVLGVINNSSLKFKEEATDSISQSSIFMITFDEKVDDLRNNMNTGKLTAVLQNDTIGYSYISEMNYLRYTVVSNQVRAFNLLKEKKADVLVGVKNSILYQLEKSNLEEDYTIVSNYMVPIEYTMITKPGDKELLYKLNNGLKELRISGEYEKIHDKWINEGKYIIKETIKRISFLAFIIFVTVAVIIMINIRINKLLRKQVDEKTRELQETNKNLENQIIETRNNSELKNRIVESSPNGIIVFDRDFNITLYNQSACNITSLKELPQSIFEIELLNNLLKDKIDKLFLENTEFINEEITLKNENNDNISYRYNIYHLYDFDGSIRGAILSVDDITKELKIKEQVYEREKNKALNQIIAGIAHEIRNPLTSIKTFVELIPIKRDNRQFQSQMAEFVPKEVDRVNNLIKNLIDYAKPEKNNKEKVSISEIVKSCTVLVNPVLENKKIELNVDEEDGLTLLADKNQLKQVLINVLLNGFDSMIEKIKLNENKNEKLNMKIKTWKSEENIYIQITDEGMGMTDEQIKKSTEPFYTTKSGGTGLGLALSKQFVEENNGEMIIESEPQTYTKITLRFRR